MKFVLPLLAYRKSGASRTLEIFVLEDGRYVRRNKSAAVPILDSKTIQSLMETSLEMKRPAWARYVRERIRELIKNG